MAADKPAELARGTRLGRFEILRLLGSGAMGEVYAARSEALEGFVKLVAIKRLLPSESVNRSEGQLLHEARIMAGLHHPNIAQVYEAGRSEGCAFFAMEYVHGQSLGRTLARLAHRGRGLSLQNALWIVKNVAAALHYAHDKRLPDGRWANIVHRDVCPANVMLTYDGAVKLIDFGVAKAATATTKTAPGSVKGNLRYMSPEQIIGLELDRRSDIFSLGIVLFELTTGTRFIRERDDQKAAEVVLTGKLPRPSERRSGYSTTLEAVVMQALSRNADERFDDARQLQQAIEEFARDEQMVLSDIELSNTMQQLFGDSAEFSTQRELLVTLGLSEHGPPRAALATAVSPQAPVRTGTLRMQTPESTDARKTLSVSRPMRGPQPPLATRTDSPPFGRSGETLPLVSTKSSVRAVSAEDACPQDQRNADERRNVVRRVAWGIVLGAVALLLLAAVALLR